MRVLGSMVILALAARPATAATPPPGLVETVLVPDSPEADGVQRPTGIAYEPGTGNLWILESGDETSPGTTRVRLWHRDTRTVTTALTISCLDGVGERALTGIAFDPDYLAAGDASRFVYLYYTRAITSTGECATGDPAGSRNRVARFRESGGHLVEETVILQGPYLGSTNHNGGSLKFAADKTLFVAMGDNDTEEDPFPAARDLGDLRGKILRIERDGSAPPDNPFVSVPGVLPEIWAWGLRNPFRTTMDGADFYIADVGQHQWEEIDVGAPGADYGWPCFEGPDVYHPCDPPPADPVPPAYAYGHDDQTPPVSGDAIVSGPVYRDTVLPEEYRGHLFYGDYVDGWIRHAAIGAGHALTDAGVLLPDANGVVDMAVSPAGCLTWVSFTGDGVRDVCEIVTGSDIDGSLRVDGADLAWLARVFGSTCTAGAYDVLADIDRDCDVDGEDLAILASQFGVTRPGS